MTANELEPSTLEPLIPGSCTSREDRHGGERSLTDDLGFGGIIRIGVLEQPVHRKGRFASQEVGLDCILVGRHRARVAESQSSRVCFIQVKHLHTLVVVEGRLAAGIQEGATIPKEQGSEITDYAFLLVPRPDDREFSQAFLL